MNYELNELHRHLHINNINALNVITRDLIKALMKLRNLKHVED